jgi:hypothetical protein
MPPLICPSPIILDQSFPRTDDELRRISNALGMIQQQLKNNEIHLLVTLVQKQFIYEFDWSKAEIHPLLRDIRRLMSQLFTRSDEKRIDLDVSNILEYNLHPLPEGCEGVGLSEIWADEMGRTLVKHDSCCPRGAFFIGIACDLGYAGCSCRKYTISTETEAFPMVCPANINQRLIDAYEWNTSSNIENQKVHFSDIYRNYKAIGGTSMRPPNGSSHYEITFSGGRTWPLDRKFREIPPKYLSELVNITGYPIGPLKEALLTGTKPHKVSRL